MGLFTVIKFSILPISSHILFLSAYPSAVVVTIIDLEHVLIII